jgi:hypothetical protein
MVALAAAIAVDLAATPAASPASSFRGRQSASRQQLRTVALHI